MSKSLMAGKEAARMKLGDFIRLNKQKGVSYSIVAHIFLTIMVSFNFDVIVGRPPLKSIVEIDIFEKTVSIPASEEQKPEQGVSNEGTAKVVESPQNSVPSVGAPQPDPTATATTSTSSTGTEQKTEQALWACGIATPRPHERAGFAGAWARKCKVPPEDYFKEWHVSRVSIMSAIVGEGSIKVDENVVFERDSSNGGCDKDDVETKFIEPHFDFTHIVEIPKCEMSGCSRSKCWTVITYYGTSDENKVAPPLSNWATLQDRGHLVYTLDSQFRGEQRSVAEAVPGTKCEDFGGYTSFDDCHNKHKPHGCEGMRMGKEPATIFCWKALGEKK